jgi:hypothetical protein
MMATPLATDAAVHELYVDFDNRLQAARLANHLNRIFVDPVDKQNPLGEDFALTVIENRRCYVVGHWQIIFSVLHKDDRGLPPQVWLSLNFFHHFAREGEPITVVSFDQFTETSCRSILGMQLRGAQTSLIQKTIIIDQAPTDEYADVARHQIMTMLKTPVPLIGQLRRALRAFSINKNNEVLNEDQTRTA